MDLLTHIEEGQEWSLSAVQRIQVLLRLCGSDEHTGRTMSTILATGVGRLLSLEGDELVASETVLSSLAIVASCLHQGIMCGHSTCINNITLSGHLYLESRSSLRGGQCGGRHGLGGEGSEGGRRGELPLRQRRLVGAAEGRLIRRHGRRRPLRVAEKPNGWQPKTGVMGRHPLLAKVRISDVMLVKL